MLILIGLLFSSLAAWAGPEVSCEHDALLVQRCFDSWERSHAKDLVEPTKRSESSMDLVVQARIRTRSLYYSSIYIRSCIAAGEELISNCGSTHSDVIRELSYQLKPAVARMKHVQEEAKKTIAQLLEDANGLIGGSVYALNCHMRTLTKGGYQICFVVDRSLPDYQFVSLEDEKNLPITVGVTPDCTFFVDQAYRLVTADHCGTKHMNDARIFTPGIPLMIGAEAERLRFSAHNFESGPPIEDYSIYRPALPMKSPGKPFYYLAWDNTMEFGCELRRNSILACSDASLQALSGRRAEMIAFPSPYYSKQAEGELNRLEPGTVMKLGGDLTFDPYFGRFFVQLYAQPGASGAPVYLPAGNVVGGILLDRPLVLGPLTGASGTPGRIVDGMTDNMGVVAAVRYERLSRLLMATDMQMVDSEKLPQAKSQEF